MLCCCAASCPEGGEGDGLPDTLPLLPLLLLLLLLLAGSAALLLLALALHVSTKVTALTSLSQRSGAWSKHTVPPPRLLWEDIMLMSPTHTHFLKAAGQAALGPAERSLPAPAPAPLRAGPTLTAPLLWSEV